VTNKQSYYTIKNIKEYVKMVSRVPMSRGGYKRLREELERLEKKERPNVIRAIEVARAHGDLSENAEYHASKERQGMIEGRILELRDKLVRAEVIDCSKVDCQRAVFGTIVTLVDMDTDEEVTYQLLGPEESDVKKGSISVLSPIGRSIIGKTVGDDVVTKTPSGIREFELLEISAGLVD
jgi:transcription elongation factor GreA